jgi:DNA-binding beta-propeller fold protein YncE
VKTRTKHPTDITVGAEPRRVAVTPDHKTAFVADVEGSEVSTIDVKTRKKPHRHHGRRVPGRGGVLAVSPVTGTDNPR